MFFFRKPVRFAKRTNQKFPLSEFANATVSPTTENSFKKT